MEITSLRPLNHQRRDERMWVAPQWAELMATHGIVDAETLFTNELGEALRRLPQRENWRLTLEAPNQSPQVFYLKKHHKRTLGTLWRSILNRALPQTPAFDEAMWSETLKQHGIATLSIAAVGERVRSDGTLISSLLTPELNGYEALDLFLIPRFEQTNAPELSTLIQRCAEIARSFHGAGFNHRDFYTCHFFVKDSGTTPGDFDICLIDLQRVQQWPRGLRGRWIVKDLAQLAYSVPRRIIGRTRQMRFFKCYLQTERLSPTDKRLARRVLKRAAQLQAKHGSYRPEWEAETHALSNSTPEWQKVA